MVLRIEDTDRERSTQEALDHILDSLKWLGLDWDEGPFLQSERADHHRALAARLLEDGAAYRCFCPRERLVALREARRTDAALPAYDGACRSLAAAESSERAGEAHTVRFRVPEERVVEIDDLVRGTVGVATTEIEDWIMVRSDGDPTYNFVVTCDDLDMDITHVLRGEDHLTNTPKQVLLAEALGGTPPRYGHVPLILSAGGGKLSKREGGMDVASFRERGFPPEAMVNFLALLGWSPGDDREIMPLEDIVSAFTVEGIAKSAAHFDEDKLAWMSGEVLRGMAPDDFRTRAVPFLEQAGRDHASLDPQVLAVALAGEQERVRTLAEVPERLEWLFEDAVVHDEEALASLERFEGRRVLLEAWMAVLSDEARPFNAEALSAAAKALVKDAGAKMPALFLPLRVALTGRTGGPDLFVLHEILGRERCLARIRALPSAAGDA